MARGSRCFFLPEIRKKPPFGASPKRRPADRSIRFPPTPIRRHTHTPIRFPRRADTFPPFCLDVRVGMGLVK
jgi:hypothetical protein